MSFSLIENGTVTSPACFQACGVVCGLKRSGAPDMAMIYRMSRFAIACIASFGVWIAIRKGWIHGVPGTSIAGAIAHNIGQVLAAVLVLVYLAHYKTVKLSLKHFRPQAAYALRAASLGTASFVTQLSLMVFQIVMNKSLKYYGGLSVYGSSIPIACVGIITKVSQVAFSFIIGISQGMQPIASFNYGAKQYTRVKQVYQLAIKAGVTVSVIAGALFLIFPRQIIGIFGDGSPEYFEFGVLYFRTYLVLFFLCFMVPLTSNFFTAIGKPKYGTFLSLTRQILFLVPLILILPIFLGIHGILFAGPVADGMAFLAAVILIRKEFRRPEWSQTS